MTEDARLTVVLQDDNNNTVAVVTQPGNAQYLTAEDPSRPLLSELSLFDYDMFGASDMPQVKRELGLMLKEPLSDDHKRHLQEIIEMATRCEQNPGWVLVFTPFHRW